MSIKSIGKTKCRKIAAITLVVLASTALMGMSRNPPPHAARLVNLDFVPENGGGYTINATGQQLTYADVKFYNITVELDRPSPADFAVTYQIFGDEFWSDPLIGEVSVRFNRNSTTPTEIVYLSTVRGARTPSGAPNQTEGRFWLGCTQRLVLRGNAGRGHDREAPVYLKRSGTVFFSNEGVTIGGTPQSSSRDVLCQ